MEYLQNVNVTFDEGETSVNFAKAAMVLQGGASVYSKKVDFLWQSVLQTMDLLRNKKEGEGAQDYAYGEYEKRDSLRPFPGVWTITKTAHTGDKETEAIVDLHA